MGDRKRAELLAAAGDGLNDLLYNVARHTFAKYHAGIEGEQTRESWSLALDYCKTNFQVEGIGSTGKPKSRTPSWASAARRRIISRRDGPEKKWETEFANAHALGDEAECELILSGMLQEQMYLLIYGVKASESSKGTPGMNSSWRVPTSTTVIPELHEDTLIGRWLMKAAAKAVTEYTNPDKYSWATGTKGAGTLERLQMILEKEHEAHAWEMQLVVGKYAKKQRKKPPVYRKPRKPRKPRTPDKATETRFLSPNPNSEITIDRNRTRESSPITGTLELEFGLAYDCDSQAAVDVMCGLATMSGPLTRINTEDALANVLWTCEDSE